MFTLRVTARRAMLLLAVLATSAQLHAQEFVKKYTSPQGLYWWHANVVGDWQDRADANGDGTPEVILQAVDEEGHLSRLLVTSLAKSCDEVACSVSAITIWDYERNDLEAMSLESATHFLGFLSASEASSQRLPAIFLEVDGTENPAIGKLHVVDLATKSSLFVFPSAALDAASKAEAAGRVRFAILDVDGDHLEDLVIGDPQTRTVQVWGVGSAGTATEERIEARLLQLSQSYPNPFRTSTTISYTVERPGPVAIEIFDVVGRSVRRLVEEDRPRGSYTATWDGTDDRGQPVASGRYFYRLRIGDSVGSKQVIRID